MSEFKAQILGILIVIGVFATLSAGYKKLVGDTWTNVSNQVSSIINTSGSN